MLATTSQYEVSQEGMDHPDNNEFGPKDQPLTPSTLIELGEQSNLGVFSTRPGHISITVDIMDACLRPLGYAFGIEEDDGPTLRIVDTHPQGLLSLEDPTAQVPYDGESRSKTVLHIGDELVSVNGMNCRDLLAGDERLTIEHILNTLFEEEAKTLTFVFETTSARRNELCLCQAYVLPSSSNLESMPHGILFCQSPQKGHLQIDSLSSEALRYSVLKPKQLVLGIGACPSLMLESAAAEVLTNDLTTLCVTSVQPPKGWKDHLTKAAVGVGGGSMVGVGAVMMVTPLHPVGHAMAMGGVCMLSTQFEGPRRAMRKAKSFFPRRANRQVRTN